jgi:hypothetical protein
MAAPAQISSIETVFSQIVLIAIAFGGAVFVIVILWGGLQFLMAGTNKEGAAKAQGTLTFGVIGLVVLVSAWLILNVLGKFLGLPNIGTFKATYP